MGGRRRRRPRFPEWEFPGGDAWLDQLGMAVEGFAILVSGSGIGIYRAARKGDWKGLSKYGLSLTGNTIGLAGAYRGHDKIGATAYANLDERGTQQNTTSGGRTRQDRSRLQTTLWTTAGIP
jgi:hypothetical protein